MCRVGQAAIATLAAQLRVAIGTAWLHLGRGAHHGGTKEDDQPCLLHLHAVSLVARTSAADIRHFGNRCASSMSSTVNADSLRDPGCQQCG